MTPDDFSRLMALHPDPMFLLSASGQILATNEVALGFLKADSQSLIGQSIGHVVADSPENVGHLVTQALQNPKPVTSVLSFPTDGGQTDLLPIEMTSVSGDAASGERQAVLRVMGPEIGTGPTPNQWDDVQAENADLNSQVMQQQHAELLLRDEKERLRVTLSSIGDAVIATDRDGHIVSMNPVAEELTRWAEPDALGYSLVDVFHIVNETTRLPVENPALRALREGIIVGLANHTVLIAKDGTERPIDDSAAPIRDSSGNSIGSVLVFRDVSERRKTEIAQARLAAIVENSNDAIVSKTLDGIILTWNHGAEKLFGYTPQEAIGRPITMIIPSDRQDEEREILSRISRGENVDHFETIRIAKDGRQMHISLTVSPIRDSHGDIVGASKVARDISDRKKAELAVREADQRKDDFLALLAHELRNPLAPLQSTLDIFAMSELDPAVVRQAQSTMSRQVRHLVRLVDDLLDVSRITRNRLELRKERLELASVVQQAAEITQPLSDCVGNRLSVRLPEETISLEADPVRLVQVFSNLIHNACKFTGPEGTIEVSLERDGNDATVKVRDSGCGITSEKLASIFDMFVQAETTVGKSKGGLGIGLTLAKKLVELHGSTIDVRSVLGIGSTFIVRLPIQSLPPPAATDDEPHDSLSTSLPKKILIIDDNRDAADTVAMLLKILGHESESAYTAEEGIQAAETIRPQLIFLDIGLPSISGYEVCRILRSKPWGREVTIYALTGWGQESDRAKSTEAGFDDHLVKPLDVKKLTRLLQTSP